MAAPTNMYISSSVTGLRESLLDDVSNVSRVDTQFYSKIGASPEGKPKNYKHEWLTDVVPAAASNAQTEGDSYSASAITAATRLYNTLQIQNRIFSIARSAKQLKGAGGVSTEAYQTALFMKALAGDTEFAALRGVRNDSGARQMRGALNWCTTNIDKASDANLNTDGTITGGADRTLSAELIRNVTQNIFDNSTGNPDTIYIPSNLSKRITDMAGAGNYRQMVEEGKLNTYVNVFATEFNFEFQIKPHKHMPAKTLFMCDHSTWKKATLFPATKKEWGFDSDGDQYVIEQEWTLEARAETCNGRIVNIT